ncbi:3-hydroxyisobutyryl-CoA hydrolase [Corynebacterium phocae]|uniref:3-hydroxyisobutyryl-CoA hydrolase n=1 Tax=Corynebacterium phocae TaxID=161895 RepID=A0A1L7D4A5_9CORY|nr:3-hydroxyisobutyryl-CoA hydrolase [Corynebacterium phocae]APT92945.1 3-hydroxyisobutyryl-CoA hydrolase [Corynebacterium phocae]KAA8723279.1 enoyl-CoA hydratase/isomerase family protein [Corynebacterium phocae]
MTDAPVLTSIRNRTGIVELNRPKALNSLNLEMIELISEALEQWRDDDSVDQILVKSNHPKAFCAGGDVRAVRDGALEKDWETVEGYFAAEYDLNARISEYPKPYIAVIDGVVMGGGLGISAHGSHLIVTDKAFAAMPELAIGYVTDVGLAYRSQRMVGNRGKASSEIAKYWGITGYRMYAADMLYTGLATGYVEDPDSYIEEVIAKGVENVETSTVDGAPLAEKAEEIEAAFRHTTWSEILDNASPRLREELEEYTASASPTSLVAALALYDFEEGVQDVREALNAELRLGSYLVRQPDFAEGVRAVLVDKTRDADFQPETVDGVDRQAILDVVHSAS